MTACASNRAVPLIAAEGLTKCFAKHTALRAVSLSVARGEVVAVIGPSGSGKSTLIRCLNGLLVPDAGTIRIDGAPVDMRQQRAWRAVRLRVGMVFQDCSLFPHLSVLQNITLAPVRTGRMRREQAAETARNLLARVQLADKADAYPAQLSGGQLQRVAIVRALAMAPEALLLDEPTSALDPEMIAEVLDVLRTLSREGMTMVIVTHEIGFAREAASRVIFMDQAEIVEQGAADAVLTAPREARTRTFLDKIL